MERSDNISEIDQMIKLQGIKDKLEDTQSMSEIADIVDSLNETESKKLLKLYIYSR